MRFTSHIAPLLLLASAIQAHFVLQIPTSLGFDDEAETDSPCGGFNVTDRSKGVTNWPVKGGAIGVITTHLNVTWEYKVSLLSNPTAFVPVTRVLSQQGVGSFCEPVIPGISGWVNRQGVLQVIQHGPDGILYQCAAIKFIAGGPQTLPSGCTNSSGTTAHWL